MVKRPSHQYDYNEDAQKQEHQLAQVLGVQEASELSKVG